LVVDLVAGRRWSNLGGVHGGERAVAGVGVGRGRCFRSRLGHCRWRRRPVAADAVPGGGKDHEEEAGKEPDGQRHVGEELLPGFRLRWDEALLHATVAEGEHQENRGADDRVQQVPLLQLLALHLLLFLSLVVEQGRLAQLAVEELEAGPGGIPVVGDAVLVRDAVGDAEEASEQRQEADEPPGEPEVDVVVLALAALGEGRRQRRADRQELRQVRRRPQRLVHQPHLHARPALRLHHLVLLACWRIGLGHGRRSMTRCVQLWLLHA
jgi:hypothetical protein